MLENGYTEEAKELIESYKLLGFAIRHAATQMQVTLKHPFQNVKPICDSQFAFEKLHGL